MTFNELSQKRFSVRKYTPAPVSDADLAYVLEAARMAPSACNRQPWKFLVVRSEEAKSRLRQCYDRQWFATAPLYIVCLRDTRCEWVRPDDNKPHGDIDVAIATQQICLAAADRGLGTCWVCNFNVEKLRESFVPDGFEPVAIVPLGHAAPDCVSPAKTRKAISDIVETL